MNEITIDLPDKTQMIAEANFLRAFMYFRLIERFGIGSNCNEGYELGDQGNLKEIFFDECVPAGRNKVQANDNSRWQIR